MNYNQRKILILLALFTGGAVPIQFVTLSFGYAQLIKQVSLGPKVVITAHEFASFYIPIVYIPSLLLLLAITLYSRTKYPDLYRRIVVGLAVGAISTIALDAVRQSGVIHGWLPADMPILFGKAATGSGSFTVYYPVGLFIHFFNGANFGLVYAFIWGKRKNNKSAVLWAIFWLLLMELGMMTAPPMGPMVGPFGTNYAWPELFILTFIAHVAFGVVLGLLTQHFLKDEDKGGLIQFLRRSSSTF
ncbi:MAG: hypothetical protein ACUZ8E_13445 [Candidatus Anammoxibacter sp.]